MNKTELAKQDAKFAPVAKTKISLMMGKLMSALQVVIKFGGGSYTDSKTLVVGTPEFVLDTNPGYKEACESTGLKFTYIEVWMMRTALLIHETAHLLFSSFREFKKFQDWAIVEFDSLKSKLSPNGQKVLPQVIRKVAAQLANALEDGRVEHFVVNKFPGSAKYLRFLNGVFWKKGIKPAQSNVVNLIMSLCYVATSGVAPQYFKKLDQELQDNVINVWDDVLDVINTASPTVATKKMQRIMVKLKPYLEKILVPEIENAATLQEILELLAEMADFQNANPADKADKDLDGSSLSIHIKVKGAGKPGKGKGKGSGSGESSKDKPEESEDGSGEGEGEEGKDKEDGSEGSEGAGGKDGEEEEKDKKGSGGSDGEDEEQDGKSKKDRSKDKPAAKRDTPTVERGGDETDGEDDSDPVENNGQGTSQGNKAPDSENEDIDAINEAIKADIDKELEESAKAEASAYAGQVKKAEKEAAKEEGLTADDIAAIRGGYDDPRVEGYKSVDVNVAVQAPAEIQKRGKFLGKQAERYFKQQEVHDLRGQHSGRLDKKSLHKIGVNDYRIFEKKGQPFTIDTCIEIVWDGSGSMQGGKQKQSTIACATIEEAFKKLIPMKIINFTTEGNVVKHYNVKGFNDKLTTKNYAYSYGASRSFNGGNKDGYSIKVATTELMKRSESNKIMIIMSDGLPSDYNSHQAALNDVKVAVKEARKKGIKVIAMFFGDERFRRDTLEEYKYMYEKNLISCAPEDITKMLVKEIKLLLMSK